MSDQNHSHIPFRNVPNNSENFGNVPKDTETFRTVPNLSERKENHTLSVREVARMFEAAGVVRTERSIINWCQPNKLGVSRLDSYFDPNERKYFITLQSVEPAIKEEQAKVAKYVDGSEPVGTLQKRAEGQPDTKEASSDGQKESIKTFQQELMDLKITNRAKDLHIEQLHKERESFVEKLIITSRKVGELEAKLLQLEAPSSKAEVKSEPSFETTSGGHNPVE